MKIRLAATAVAILVLASCGSVRYPTSYLLNLPAGVQLAVRPQSPLGSVVVNEFRCPDYLCEGRITYRPTPEEVGFYEYHRWAASPRQAITQSMADTLRASLLFKSVAFHERGTRAEYMLTGNIERLEEVDEGREVRALCTISAQLRDIRTGAVIWNHTAWESVPVQTRSVSGVVRSLSRAAGTVVDRLVASVAKELASRLEFCTF
ncbi:MAG: ABC-type transport auxiliary lipoprotein family protein [Bryobacteraceae bacterium]